MPRKRKFKLENLKEVINKQMEIAWYKERFEQLQKIGDGWHDNFETTYLKELEWVEYLREYLKPFVPKEAIENEVGHFVLNYGLKCDYPPQMKVNKEIFR